ncbi:MAG: hypothetical protein KGI02_03895, partial [Thaumarchaeota archaeon]|nr:hypothetical protein [Nitrososphaerota archaeon]
RKNGFARIGIQITWICDSLPLVLGFQIIDNGIAQYFKGDDGSSAGTYRAKLTTLNYVTALNGQIIKLQIASLLGNANVTLQSGGGWGYCEINSFEVS